MIDIPCIALFAALNSDNELLLIKRNKQPRKDYYSFVGGHSYQSELLVNALKREVQEELNCGLTITVDYYIKVVGSDNSSTTDDHFMKISKIDSSIINGMIVSYPHVNKLEMATSSHRSTSYNLFIGHLDGAPSTSSEVKSFARKRISDWIVDVKKGVIKMQPVDFLLLQLLENDRK